MRTAGALAAAAILTVPGSVDVLQKTQATPSISPLVYSNPFLGLPTLSQPLGFRLDAPPPNRFTDDIITRPDPGGGGGGVGGVFYVLMRAGQVVVGVAVATENIKAITCDFVALLRMTCLWHGIFTEMQPTRDDSIFITPGAHLPDYREAYPAFTLLPRLPGFTNVVLPPWVEVFPDSELFNNIEDWIVTSNTGDKPVWVRD